MNAAVEHEESIFLAALEQPTAAERAAFLEQACGPDAALQARLRHLLALHDESGGLLDAVRPEFAATAGMRPIAERPGAIIGPYKLLEQIGEGGMGLVFVAEQQQPVRRKVALKLIKPGMDTREVVARFEAERQALALMEHPNIARVLDAGATPSGRPYFVMELVRGVPITEFCDANRLTPRERLDLVVHVCQAVQHAHQKGVIHRDLKPGNVLVTLHDGSPVVKVIDFGVAKAIGQQLTEKTIYTRFAQMVGTPLYMSPEQAEMSGLDIDTRTDIYALGVLLYELLSGATPFDKQRLGTVPFDEMRRIIREEEPARPSTRVSTLGQAASTVSSNRRSDPRRLRQLIRGELDWIVMKALEKDRNHRYETASALAADLQRHLNDEPVQACPRSVIYRVRKFARRNQGAFGAALAAALVMLFAVVGLTVSNVRITQEKNQKVAALGQARINEEVALQHRREAQENLKEALAAVDQMLTRVSEKHLAFVPQMAEVRRDLLQDALTFYQRLLERKTGDPAIRRETALAYGRLGRIYFKLGQDPQAEQALGQSLAMLEDMGAQGALDPKARDEMIRFYKNLGWLLGKGGRGAESESVRRKALAHAETLAAEFPDVPIYRSQQAGACIDLGDALRATRRDDAEEFYRRAIALATGAGNRHEAGRATLALGELLAGRGRLPEAAEAFRAAQATYEQVLRDAPHLWQSWQRLGDAHLLLGRLLADTGRAVEAEQALRQGVAVQEKLCVDYPAVPSYREALTSTCAELAFLLASVDKLPEAEAVLRRLSERNFEPRSAAELNGLAWLLAACPAPSLRDPPRALALAQRAIELAPGRSECWRTLGAAHYRTGGGKAAIAALEKSLQLRPSGDGFTWLYLAMAHRQLGEEEAARRWLDQADAWMEQNKFYHPDLPRLRAEVTQLREDHGQ